MSMEYTLLEILEAREQRALRQKELLSEFPATLLCFTMNIPGPDKDGVLIQKGFQLGNRLLKGCLKSWKILYEEKRCTPAGWEAFYCIEAIAEDVKTVTVLLEDKTPGGRVFDMDVLDALGTKLDRESLGFAKRKCLLCQEEAAVCGRSRKHSVQELYDAAMELIERAITEEVSRLAVQSLLCEVYATPKPGLVDRNNNGSHTDMDLKLFLTSTATLWEYFRRCAKIGLYGTDPVAVFQQLRQAGLEAEKRMFAATKGVNTHKGAIFSMGILCGAVGSLDPEYWEDPRQVGGCCSLLAKGLVRKDYEFMEQPVTTGEKLFETHGITGARGQAEAGFPGAFRVGLPMLEKALDQGLSFNDALCNTLLHILITTWDTNLIKRGGMVAYGQIQAMLERLLQAQPLLPMEIIEQLDKAFIKQNLSPGGSADLLSATCFAYFLKHP